MSTPAGETATVETKRAEPWRTKPGWGIRVDLTPPEVLDQRTVARLRRQMGTGLVVLLVLVAGAFALAARHHAAAESALEQEQATASELAARAADFRDITSMQSDLTQLQRQIATLMASDVRMDLLSTQLSANLPDRMKITSETVSINAAGAAAVTGATDAAAATDTGATVTTIGTITLAGEGRRLDDVATYVESLQAIEGLDNVVPTSNASADPGVDFSITADLTSSLLTHRFDVEDAS